jgi:hypothetical protein
MRGLDFAPSRKISKELEFICLSLPAQEVAGWTSHVMGRFADILNPAKWVPSALHTPLYLGGPIGGRADRGGASKVSLFG